MSRPVVIVIILIFILLSRRLIIIIIAVLCLLKHAKLVCILGGIKEFNGSQGYNDIFLHVGEQIVKYPLQILTWLLDRQHRQLLTLQIPPNTLLQLPNHYKLKCDGLPVNLS